LHVWQNEAKMLNLFNAAAVATAVHRVRYSEILEQLRRDLAVRYLDDRSSRARAVCVLVGSPSVFEAECRTPRQMLLANAFCRYLEMAAVI
jgi:hypothetical protein